MNFLLTNDDGFFSQGIKTLYEQVKNLGNAVIVAPDRERSACSHSITLHKSLHWNKINNYTYSITGTPVDCIQFGLYKIFNNDKDVIVLSGVNKGENLGEDIFYSGTAGGAREAAMMGYNSLSLSLVNIGIGINFDYAEKHLDSFLNKLLSLNNNCKTFFNINIPSVEKIEGIKFTFADTRNYPDGYIERKDAVNRPYFLLGSYPPVWKNENGSDYNAVINNFISVTPVKLDCTDYGYLETLKNNCNFNN